ncbi:MAG TPA: DUF4255 domain-containing protein [Thermoanaerobaculia bacterium]|nr:DUF4255 domain-containing protein [Thermoanaerobaculia bacterium]
MSNALSIAAATATLRQVLISGGMSKVTLLPPDAAGQNVPPGGQVNLFLYETETDAAWRNQDLPGRVKPGEAGRPPLPLMLYYLLTAYSGEPEDLHGHVLLGQAMRILHDHPVLSRADIQSAADGNPPGTGSVPGSDLHEQAEHLRITLQPLPLEETSKLWTAFQAPYRLSAAYQVSVVLIESQRGMRAPLPVLTRGKDDRGATVLTGSQPLLDEVRPVLRLPAVRLGEDLFLRGQHLAGGTVAVAFQGPRGTGPFAPKELPAIADGEIVARLPSPDDLPGPVKATWPAGIYTAQVISSRTGEPDRTSSEIPFALAPRVLSVAPATAPGPNVMVTVKCTPEVRPEQRVALLFGEREVPAPPHPTQRDTFSFNLTKLVAGEYLVRLRVDGVDSIPVDLTASPPAFAADQKVKVT